MGPTGPTGINYLTVGMTGSVSLDGYFLWMSDVGEGLTAGPLSYMPDADNLVVSSSPLAINVGYVATQNPAIYAEGPSNGNIISIRDLGGTGYSGEGRIIMEVRSGRVQMRNPVISTAYGSTVPSTTGSSGVTGQLSFDSNYLYVCVGTNSWKRAGLTGW